MKRKSAPKVQPDHQGPVHLAPIETEVFGRFPSLVAHCAVTRYEDGAPRKTGWMTIKVMGTSWVVQVKDPDGGLSLSAMGPNLDEALVLADLLVGSDEAPWEADSFLTARAPKRK